MKKIIFFLIVQLSLISGYSNPQDTPSKEELRKTSEHIGKLIQRDSINNLIIEELKTKLANGGSVSACDTLNEIKVPVATSRDKKLIENVEDKIQGEDTSLVSFIVLSFLAGLLSLLTPCVFPMIPLTVTFFTTSTETRHQSIRKAILYGLSIIIIFTLFGVFAGPFLANELSTHWIPNLIFFIIFMLFGLSFLGLFEITVPSSFINKVDAQSEKGGIYGVFFMAFTLVLVSFSCTIPIVGYVLSESRGGIKLKPLLGMLSFAMAFAIPFTLFALFPQLMKKLPKSGGWLNVIKVILGFLEIALALKFLSMTDQVYHLRLLDRPIYIAIWIVIFTFMGLYLLGKIILPNDSEVKHIGILRLFMAMVPFVFVIYLLPGMFGAPLKALSGYLPPMTTHDFDLPGIIRENTSGSDYKTICSEPKYSKQLELPHGLKGYFTYEEALKCAKEKNLPLFVDFTGHACVSCREMEANVWSDPEVLKMLKQDFVIASLYVDDRTVMAEEDWYTSPYDNKIKKTLGAKNTELSVQKFGVNAQPYYVILDPNTEKPLVTPIGYEPSVVKYMNFMSKGLNKYNQLYPKK